MTVPGAGRSDEFWPWMSHVLLPYVHGNQSDPELGPPRLRQVRLQEGELGRRHSCPGPFLEKSLCLGSGLSFLAV